MNTVLDRTKPHQAESLFQPRSLNTNLAELEQALGGLIFPATKSEIIEKAKENKASSDTLSFFRILPPGKYINFHEITFMAWSFLII
ncbi:DUF2795 domain-containing protein [Dehalogenimonas alkenigignens]|uniref:DUF2795 domain-containing protein n=1 Tax=Dehalogenimonas alkenigignens TaxID=1217799 RepID=UPI000D5646E4|nr:DUF2795 domain-containing protein [Dehalogenimonas alkenigignens]PVV83102.1 hypothetical protein DD509_07355 [Dehalogenimonas alkenigignens]